MSNQEAIDEAGKWIGAMKLPKDLTGKTVDVRPHLASLPENETFRRMVIQAAVKKLRKRGAKEIIGVRES